MMKNPPGLFVFVFVTMTKYLRHCIIHNVNMASHPEKASVALTKYCIIL